MIVFKVKVVTMGGTLHEYTVREADVEPAVRGERLQITDLLHSLHNIYAMYAETGDLMDTYKFEFTQEDIPI